MVSYDTGGFLVESLTPPSAGTCVYVGEHVGGSMCVYVGSMCVYVGSMCGSSMCVYVGEHVWE